MGRLSERMERIRQWRDTVISLAGIAVVLGVVANLLAASLYEKNWRIAAIFLFATIAILAAAINVLYRRFAADDEVFECILPLAVDLEKRELNILIIPPYPCSAVMHQAMAVALRRESELKTDLLHSFAQRRAVDPFHRPQPLWVFLHALVFYGLVNEFREFANKSLGHGAIHGPWASLAVDLEKEKRKVRDLDQVLWKALARFKEPPSEDLSIHLPPGSTLSVSMDKEPSIPSGFTLATRYATLSITIFRFWSNASPISKTGRVVRRVAADLPGQQELLHRIDTEDAHLWIGKIPVRVSVRFRPLWALSPKAELVYAWGAECVEYLRDRMAWSPVLEGETERLLVELHRKIETFGDEHSA
jgi:hypothetical protein